jgi:hypothetical protein
MPPITVTVSEMVWYVRDVVDADNPAGGDDRPLDERLRGRSRTRGGGGTPDDYIFVFEGNTGTTALDGGIVLNKSASSSTARASA